MSTTMKEIDRLSCFIMRSIHQKEVTIIAVRLPNDIDSIFIWFRFISLRLFDGRKTSQREKSFHNKPTKTTTRWNETTTNPFHARRILWPLIYSRITFFYRRAFRTCCCCCCCCTTRVYDRQSPARRWSKSFVIIKDVNLAWVLSSLCLVYLRASVCVCLCICVCLEYISVRYTVFLGGGCQRDGTYWRDWMSTTSLLIVSTFFCWSVSSRRKIKTKRNEIKETLCAVFGDRESLIFTSIKWKWRLYDVVKIFSLDWMNESTVRRTIKFWTSNSPRQVDWICKDGLVWL